MGQGRLRLLFAAAATLGALAASSPAAASTSCTSRLLADWRDGRIDAKYAVPCYRQALARLPEDVRVYSTAETDIARALHARVLAASSRASAPSRKTRDGGGSTVVVLAITGAILLAAGSLAAAVRR